MIEIGGRLIFSLYLIIGGGLLLMSLTHIYHAIRFGGKDPVAIASAGIFIAGIVVIIWASLSLLSTVDWSTTFTIALPSVHGDRLIPPSS